MPYVDSGAARIYYESEGAGPALVFAHGAGGNAASWWQQVPHFAGRFQVITFDHRGYARSASDPAQFSPVHFDADLIAILDDLDVAKAHVVCQSMGGWTGVRAAVNYPDRILSLTLANTPGAIYSDALRDQMRTLVPRPADADLTAMTLGAPFKQQNPAGQRCIGQSRRSTRHRCRCTS
ncbi:MAG: alpha/beta hydrolase [Gammaproteobacteria bacterium]|nr:alpha/beta hydrolase [Gammaproteobacteria bacterium]